MCDESKRIGTFIHSNWIGPDSPYSRHAYFNKFPNQPHTHTEYVKRTKQFSPHWISCVCLVGHWKLKVNPRTRSPSLWLTTNFCINNSLLYPLVAYARKSDPNPYSLCTNTQIHTMHWIGQIEWENWPHLRCRIYEQSFWQSASIIGKVRRNQVDLADVNQIIMHAPGNIGD